MFAGRVNRPAALIGGEFLFAVLRIQKQLEDAPIVDAVRGIDIADFRGKGQAVYRPAQPVPPDAICRYRVFGHFLPLRKNASHREQCH